MSVETVMKHAPTGRRQFLKHASLAGAASLVPEAVAQPRPPVQPEYDLDPSITYLNHASIGTMPRAVREARAATERRCESNPWLHVWGGGFDDELDAARAAAASSMHAPVDDVAIVRSTTEAFAILAGGLDLGPGDEVLFSSLNHVGASKSFVHRAKERGFDVRRFRFPLEEVSSLSAADVVAMHRAEITGRTRLLVLPHLDNRVGIRHPVKEIAAMARDLGVEWVAVDGAQTIGMFDVDVPALGVDLYATSSHKWLQAPKGTGLMFVAAPLRERLRPQVVTWGQSRWRGSARKYEDFGTRDPATVLALGEAVRRHAEIPPSEREQRLAELRSALEDRVDADARLRWRSPTSFEAGGALGAIEVPGRSCAELAAALWEGDRVVVRGFEDDAGSTLRVSPNIMNVDADLDRLVEALDRLL